MYKRQVYQLIDARHGLKPNDLALMDEFDTAAVSYQIVLTKADKNGLAKAEAVKAEVEDALIKRPAAYPEVLITSSEKKIGIGDLQQTMFDVLSR